MFNTFVTPLLTNSLKVLHCQQKSVRTEITFDFHRLGVLLLRAAVLDGALVARKIATATIAEAKIQATLGE